jgi:hypothetical protein
MFFEQGIATSTNVKGHSNHQRRHLSYSRLAFLDAGIQSPSETLCPRWSITLQDTHIDILKDTISRAKTVKIVIVIPEWIAQLN